MKKEIMTTESEEIHGFANETDKQSSTSEDRLMQAIDEMKNNTEMVERHDIEHTPFKAIREQNQWYLCLGKYRLNEHPYKTREEVEKDVNETNWFRLMAIMRIVAEDVLQQQVIEAKMRLAELVNKEKEKE